MSDAERMMLAALERRARNGWAHKHHAGCIHNLPPEEQIAARGRTVEQWLAIHDSMPAQITPDEWEEEPLDPEPGGSDS